MAYAENTTIPVSKSRIEIEELIRKYGAGQFVSGYSGNRAVIGFTLNGRQIKFVLEIPEGRTDRQTQQFERQRWRALLLVIKAKLEAVESGISSFDEEFMSNIVLSNGITAGDYWIPQIEKTYRTGQMPPMLGEEIFIRRFQ